MAQDNSRIGMPPVDTLNPVQRRIYDATIDVLGAPIGPRMVLLSHTEVVEAWSALAKVLKNASFPKTVRELVVLMVAQHWKADFEWYAHEPEAVKAGWSAEVIDALRSGKRPELDALHSAVYAYVDSMQKRQRIPDDVYAAARTALGDRGLIELTVLMGHYTNVAMTLIAHEVALPEGAAKPF